MCMFHCPDVPRCMHHKMNGMGPFSFSTEWNDLEDFDHDGENVCCFAPYVCENEL